MRIWSSICLVALASCADKVAEGDRVVIEIAGQQVSVAEFTEFVESSVHQEDPFLAGEVMTALLEDFIEEQLLLRAADDAGVQADPEFLSRRV